LIADESWFAFVCHLDPCAACLAAGKSQPSDDCLECDDWKVEGPHWLKANPNLGVSVSWEYLREQVSDALSIPSARNLVRRLNFCQWTQQATVWIPIEKWAACKTTLLPAAMVGRPCYVGIDLSDKIDLSAVVLGFPREASLQPGSTAKLDQALDVLPFFWMPKASLQKRAQDDGVPYPEWEAAGFITATTGNIIDHDAIVDFIIGTLAKKYSIQGIGIDASGGAAVVTRLKREFGDERVVEIPQSFRQLSEPSKTVEALIVSRNLAHPGHPVLDWNMANMAIEENNWREIRPVKIDQRKRIDGGVALIDLVKVLQLIPVQQYAGVVRNIADFL
jgi:phage terminase large subunit-like protein